MAQKLGIEAIERTGGRLRVRFHRESPVDPARLAQIVQRHPDVRFTPGGVLELPLDGAQDAARVLQVLKRRLAELLGQDAANLAGHYADRA